MSEQGHDIIIIGAGVMGLWAARHAIRAGRKVLVVEKRHVGAGASGGFMGGLMPHAPDRWNAKKELQFQALCLLEDEVAALESDTGLDCGYRRCGRLVPIRHEGLLKACEQRSQGALKYWRSREGDRQFTFDILPADFSGTLAQDWLSEEIAPFGATYDTLSARINPRGLVEALAHYVRQHGSLAEGVEVTDIARDGKSVVTGDGTRLPCGEIIVANGYEAYGLLGGVNATHLGRPVTGRGVKGQSLMLQHEHGDDRPMIFDDGSYVIPHKGRWQSNDPGNDLVAIGSSTQNDWLNGGDQETEASRVEPDQHGYLDHARKLCPVLVLAPIVKEWAGVRPRNTMADIDTGKMVTDPVFGALDDRPNVRLAIGGFKISFGVAHYGSRDWFA